MNKIVQQYLFFFLTFCMGCLGMLALNTTTYAQAPAIGTFFDSITDGENSAYDLSDTIDPNKSLRDNIIDLLIPAPLNPSGSPARLWVLIRNIGVGVFLFMLIFFGGQLLLFGSDENKISSLTKNLSLVIVGAIFFFGAVRLLSTIVTLGSPSTDADTIVTNINNNLFLQILGVLKAVAFFAAIIALVITAVKLMSAMDQEDKIKTARGGIVNILIALVFIKFIDFIYYIVAQPDFREPIADLLIQIATILGRILGVVLMGAIIVAGYLMVVDGGKGERFKQARGIIINILLVGFVVFLFLLVIYQLVNEF